VTGAVASWIAILVGPLAWLGCLELVYALASTHCERWPGTGLVTIVAVAGLLASTGALVGRRALAVAPSATSGRGRDRRRFMALLGILASLLFTLVILAAVIPPAILGPCD
jgi:hypothetical protein